MNLAALPTLTTHTKEKAVGGWWTKPLVFRERPDRVTPRVTCDVDRYPRSFVLNQLARPPEGPGANPKPMSDFREQNVPTSAPKPVQKPGLWSFLIGPAEKPPTQNPSVWTIAQGVFGGMAMFTVVTAVLYWGVLVILDS